MITGDYKTRIYLFTNICDDYMIYNDIKIVSLKNVEIVRLQIIHTITFLH